MFIGTRSSRCSNGAKAGVIVEEYRRRSPQVEEGIAAEGPPRARRVGTCVEHDARPPIGTRQRARVLPGVWCRHGADVNDPEVQTRSADATSPAMASIGHSRRTRSTPTSVQSLAHLKLQVEPSEITLL